MDYSTQVGAATTSTAKSLLHVRCADDLRFKWRIDALGLYNLLAA